MSGIATDIMLFSQHRARLVHPYRVYGDCVPHHSLRGSFMSRLSDFTHWACGRDSSTESISWPVRSALMPLGPAHRTPDHAPLAWKVAHAVTSAPSSDDAVTSSGPTPTSPPATTSPLPIGPAHRTLDHASPARKATRAATSITSPDETSAGVSVTTRELTRIADSNR